MASCDVTACRKAEGRKCVKSRQAATRTLTDELDRAVLQWLLASLIRGNPCARHEGNTATRTDVITRSCFITTVQQGQSLQDVDEDVRELAALTLLSVEFPDGEAGAFSTSSDEHLIAEVCLAIALVPCPCPVAVSSAIR